MINRITPYPTYRDSGSLWFQKVPAHWKIGRLRYSAQLLVSNVDKNTMDGEIAIRLCNYMDVYKNDIIHLKIPFMRATATPEEARRFKLQKGDVLITKDSEDWRDIGVPAFVGQEADDLVCGYHLAILRAKKDVLIGRYLYWLLESHAGQDQFSVGANGVTRYGLSQGTIKNIMVLLPPVDEQASIAKFLNHIDQQMICLTRKYKRLIGGGRFITDRRSSILHEYRIRLIVDVVTGKLDVREVAAKLPEEADEPEPMDEVEELAETTAEPADLDPEVEEAVA